MNYGSVDHGNVNLAEHWDLKSELFEYESSVMNCDRRYALCIQNFITDRTSPSEGAGIRTSIFNSCNDANMRTREVPIVQGFSTFSGPASPFSSTMSMPSSYRLNDLLMYKRFTVLLGLINLTERTF